MCWSKKGEIPQGSEFRFEKMGKGYDILNPLTDEPLVMSYIASRIRSSHSSASDPYVFRETEQTRLSSHHPLLACLIR